MEHGGSTPYPEKVIINNNVDDVKVRIRIYFKHVTN